MLIKILFIDLNWYLKDKDFNYKNKCCAIYFANNLLFTIMILNKCKY